MQIRHSSNTHLVQTADQQKLLQPENVILCISSLAAISKTDPETAKFRISQITHSRHARSMSNTSIFLASLPPHKQFSFSFFFPSSLPFLWASLKPDSKLLYTEGDLEFWSSCFHLASAGITGVCTTLLMRCRGLNPGLCVLGKHTPELHCPRNLLLRLFLFERFWIVSRPYWRISWAVHRVVPGLSHTLKHGICVLCVVTPPTVWEENTEINQWHSSFPGLPSPLSLLSSFEIH